jgi:hypothetical protein
MAGVILPWTKVIFMILRSLYRIPLHLQTEGAVNHRGLPVKEKLKFSYGQVLAVGELIYAYVVARLDIGEAVNLPTEGHYTALKGICCY